MRKLPIKQAGDAVFETAQAVVDAVPAEVLDADHVGTVVVPTEQLRALRAALARWNRFTP